MNPPQSDFRIQEIRVKADRYLDVMRETCREILQRDSTRQLSERLNRVEEKK